ncbi:MAG TPA: histidine kinase [Prolixibacteraceae bacterium]|nr:histidine kinase [Prolixibacteraceae bacterium]
MRRRNIILIHVLYWFYILNQYLFPLYVGQHKGSGMAGSGYLQEVLISLVLNVFTFYAVYFSIRPILASRHKGMVFLLLIVLLGVILGLRLPADWLLRTIWKGGGTVLPFEWVWVWDHLRMVVITAVYAILIRYLIHAIAAEREKAERIHRQEAGELALLRSQINPHFLFNTLNSIYALVYRKSTEAPGAVMKFSSIMRYVLEEAHAGSIPLERETEYLRNYVDLQRLRFREPGFVRMEIGGGAGEARIAPMLLIPFVEQAFLMGDRERIPGIVIRLTGDGREVRFEVKCYQKGGASTRKGDFETGLDGVRRRLELVYPRRHTLEVMDTGEEAGVVLTLRLRDKETEGQRD